MLTLKCSPLADGHMETLEVAPRADADGDLRLTLSKPREYRSIYLAREEVRTLRDHLTGILGEEKDAPDEPAGETLRDWSGRVVRTIGPSVDEQIDALPAPVIFGVLRRFREVSA